MGEKKDLKPSVNSLADNQEGEGAKKGTGRNIEGMRGLCKEVESGKKKRIIG